MLRQELDLWRQSWQQVRTFMDRISTADDQDSADRRKTYALLRAAQAIEHQRGTLEAGGILGDPAVEQLPAGASWAVGTRQFRLPGTDELELAVGNLVTVSPFPLPEGFDLVLEKVRLRTDAVLFEHIDDDGIPRQARHPSYPGALGTFVAGAGDVSVEEKDGRGSLFSRQQRADATLADDPDADDPVTTWTALTALRRENAVDDPDYSYIGGSGAPPWTPDVLGQARTAWSGIRTGLPNPLVNHVASLRTVSTVAAAAATGTVADAEDLRAAVEVLGEVGAQTLDVLDQLTDAAERFDGRPSAFTQVAVTADELADDVAARPLGSSLSAAQAQHRTDLLDALDTALDRLATVLTRPALLDAPVEEGPVGQELTVVVEERIGYPDGSLRMLRVMEWAFASSWPATLRQLRLRGARALVPRMARFREHFVTSVRALVEGGDTGLGCDGLAVGAPTPAGSTVLSTDAPASLADALDPVEPGQVAIMLQDRPTAAVVLGLDEQDGRLAFAVEPLRVSVAPGPSVPGTPGLVSADQAVGCDAPGFAEVELQNGLPAAGPAADGLLQQTLALYSRLSLLFGRETIDSELGASAVVPDPTASPVHNIELYGHVPPRTQTVIVHGLGPELWFDPGDGLHSRLARAGELLLLRGLLEPEDEESAPGPLIQGVLDVETVTPILGATFARLDTSAAAVLTTDSSRLGEKPKTLACGPREDLVLLMLRRSWQTDAMVGPLTLRRDFAGFDLFTLATGREQAGSLISRLGLEADTPPPPVDRADELAAALTVLEDWTRYSRG